MDPKFVPGFETQIRSLENLGDPFLWVSKTIDQAADRVLQPASLNLRADGKLFLLGNIAAMIVIPWDALEGQGEFKHIHERLLTSDLQTILQDAVTIASGRGESEVSANMLLTSVHNASLAGNLQITNLLIWG